MSRYMTNVKASKSGGVWKEMARNPGFRWYRRSSIYRRTWEVVPKSGHMGTWFCKYETRFSIYRFDCFQLVPGLARLSLPWPPSS